MDLLPSLNDDQVIGKIHVIRDQRIMLDRDLAELYGVKARRLREQVKRNIGNFPDHFIFQLNIDEALMMVSQFATPSKKSLGGSLPYAFTEHGILMLANVLKSQLAVQVSIRIIEILVKQRQLLATNAGMQLEIEEIKKKLHNHGQNIELVFQYLDELMEQKETQTRNPIGF